MAFAGLTSGYVVSRTTLVMNEQWMTFALPQAFIYSTIVIILSSLALIWGKRQLVAGKDSAIKPMLWVTLLLGFAFLWFQGGAWTELMANNIFFAGAQSHPAGSWVYALFIFHGLHVAGGIIALLVVLFRAYRGRYSSADYHGITLVSIYWHFVDLLWLYLYVFLSAIR